MTNGRPQADNNIERNGAQGVRHDKVSETASAAVNAHTRTMSTEGTTSFSPVDYQAPASSVADAQQNSRTQVDRQTMSRLGKHAAGVSSLRASSKASAGRRAAKQDSSNGAKIAVIVMVVVALVVAIGAFFLVRGALLSLNDSSAEQSSAVYATDSYLVFGVPASDGTLADAYLVYVDSIDSRTEMMHLDANTSTVAGSDEASGISESAQQADTFADVWNANGIEGLASAVESLGSIDVKLALVLTSDQMSQILDLASNADSTVDTAELAESIASANADNSDVTSAAIRGLLVTIKDVGPEGYTMLEEPADDVNVGERPVEVLRSADWLETLSGMRDNASDVTA